MFTPTAEQLKIKELFLDALTTRASLVIQAGAGTGKTSTLQLLAESTDRPGQYIAFNKGIVLESKTKFPANVECNTAHSLAWKAIIKTFNSPLNKRLQNSKRLPSWEGAKLLGLKAHSFGSHTISANRLYSIAYRMVGNFCNSDAPKVETKHCPWMEGLDFVDDNGRRSYAYTNQIAAFLLPYAEEIWEDLQSDYGKFRFTHAHYLKMYQLSNPKIAADFILFDEAQDANPVMQAIVANQTHATLVWVGDSCQPAGTLVKRVRKVGSGQRKSVIEDIPIEDIRKGDLVVSYDIRTGHLHRRGNRVLGVSERSFTGRLVQISAGDSASTYTPDHHCVARLGSAFAGKHVVYLMRRGHSFRLGRASGSYGGGGFGPLARAKKEGADALWILSTHDSASEAASAEALLSHRYRLPMMLFAASANRLASQDAIDSFWNAVGDLTDDASKCLVDHGRRLAFPLWEGGDGNLLMRRATTVRACNLMTGMQVPTIGTTEVEWIEATIGSCAIEEDDNGFGHVYSMTVENDHTYVGDGIITHNCQQIYSFTGAINALAVIESLPGTKVAFLTQSFRFGDEIAQIANRVLEALDAELRLKGFDKIESKIEACENPDVYLTRTNAAAMQQLFAAQSAGKKVFLVGGGKEILSFTRAAEGLMAGKKVEHADLACFNSWDEVQDYVRDDEQGAELKMMVTLIDEHGTQAIIKALGDCESEKKADLIISTAHKSKGREWEVVQLAPDFPDAPTGEELRLMYVAVTRAQIVLDITQVRYFNGTNGEVV